LLVGIVLCAARVPLLFLAVTAVTLFFCIWGACTRLQYRTQRDEMISPDKECQQRWRRYVAEFGDDEDMVVVVRGGPTARARMSAALEALADKIRRQPQHFDRLFYKVDLHPLHDRALLFLPPSEIAQIQESLEGMRRLLATRAGWSLFNLQMLLGEAAGRLKQLRPGQPLSADDERFLSQLVAITRSAATALPDPKGYRNPWPGMVVHKAEQPAGPKAPGPASTEDLLAEPQYFFSGDGELAFLLVRPTGEKDSLLGSHQSVEALRGLVEEVRPEFADLQIGLTGLPVLETDEMLASQNDTSLASWLALAGVVLLYLAVFRTLRLPFFSVTTLIVGTVWALGWMTLTVGHLNLLSATFAVMLFGMGDYGVLWVTRYNQERATGLEVLPALRVTAAAIGPSTLTAAVTTGVAFFAAMLADFMAVAELGWVAGCGVLLCAVSCCTVLPALIVLVDRRKARDKVTRWQGDKVNGILPFAPSPCHPVTLSPRQQDWLPGLARRPRWVLAVGLLLVAVLTGFAFRVRYNHNLLKLQSDSLESVRWEKTLIDHTAGASWHALSYTPTREEALRLKERYEKLPTVARVVEVASLVPSEQEAKLPRLRDIQERLRYLPRRGEKIPLLTSAPPALLASVDQLAGKDPWTTGLADGGLLRPLLDVAQPPTLLVALEQQLSEFRAALARLPATVGTDRVKDFERRMVADLADDLRHLRDVATPRPIRLVDLPESLRERYVSKGGQWLLRIFGTGNLWEYPELSRFVASVRTIDAEATGKPFTTLEGLRSMKQGFQWAGFYALGAIVLVLFLDFRTPGRVLMVLAPLVVGLGLALGVMGLFGFELNPANMIALPLMLGLGVNQGVHVLHDYLLRRAERPDRPYRLNRSTGLGILVVALTMILGFGMLMISSHRGLVGLGFILSLGVGTCMLTSLVFLPAVLNLHSRRASRVTVEAVKAPPVLPMQRQAA
jgi:hopanoid biosynthesis associated RND transporter like protein HpnN